MQEVDFGSNQFCGPSVLSAITGVNTDEAASVIQRITGSYRPVKGVMLGDLKQAFRNLGYQTTDESWVGNSVFSALHSLHGRDGHYVFMVPGHFIAIESNGNHKFICDNHTKSPINVSSSARLGMKVTALFRVEKIKEVEKPEVIPVIEPPKREPSPRITAGRIIVSPGLYSVTFDGRTIGQWTYLDGAIEALRKEILASEGFK